jgi:SMI1/KNR4 family protein SUKH-1
MTEAADRLSPELTRRLIVRAADPGRRIAPPSQFMASIQTMSLGGLLGALFGAARDVKRSVAASEEGRIDPELCLRAEEIAHQMSTPAPQPAAAPRAADEKALAAAETALGFPLPGVVRHLYAKVGNGGFGPGDGFLPLEEMVEEYHDLTGSPAGPRGQLWPERLLPIVRMEPSFICIDRESGAIIDWDVEELAEGSSNRHWEKSFKPVAKNLEAYLDEWLQPPASQKTLDDIRAEHMRAMAPTLTPETASGLTPEAKALIPPEHRQRLGLD